MSKANMICTRMRRPLLYGTWQKAMEKAQSMQSAVEAMRSAYAQTTRHTPDGMLTNHGFCLVSVCALAMTSSM